MKTVKEGKIGNSTLRVVDMAGRYVGVHLVGDTVKNRVDGPTVDDVWRSLHRDLSQTGPNYFGFEGARARFARIFEGGFTSKAYLAQERAYKIAAKQKLDRLVPLDSALNANEMGPHVLSVFRAANLLSPFEQTRMQAVLRGAQANAFVRGAARFTLGDIEGGLAAMAKALKPHNVAKWTAVTYLPFLWRPEDHLFLKPEVCKDFAERVGHPFAFDYAPALDAAVYHSFLDLGREARAQAESLKPRDFIDIQSFIWVVGKYTDEAAEIIGN